jgi:hypothetical protein
MTCRRNSFFGLDVVDTRASLLSSEKLITGDKYTFIRNAYLQNREFKVKDGQGRRRFLNPTDETKRRPSWAAFFVRDVISFQDCQAEFLIVAFRFFTHTTSVSASSPQGFMLGVDAHKSAGRQPRTGAAPEPACRCWKGRCRRLAPHPLMDQRHIGIDPHADEIALFAVVSTGLAHGIDPSIGLRF